MVVLNAAYWRQFTVDEWDSDVLRSHFDTNVMGLAYGVEAVLPEMRRRGAGTIVGMASVAGYRGFPRSEAYGATKAAEINMLEALRIDLRPLGITVQTVCPGFVRTDLTAKNTIPDAVHARGRRRGPPDLPRHREGEGRDRLPVPDDARDEGASARPGAALHGRVRGGAQAGTTDVTEPVRQFERVDWSPGVCEKGRVPHPSPRPPVGYSYTGPDAAG